ncbi:MAG: DUF378 domain-containing protein [Ruminococcus sp.]|nr:DUF378 domain-containing protein [Ruminococcus sp.]
MLDKIALTLLIVGGINWGSIGLFQFDLVAFLFGGQSGVVSRIVYVIVALAALWCISLLFRDTTEAGDRDYRTSAT